LALSRFRTSARRRCCSQRPAAVGLGDPLGGAVAEGAGGDVGEGVELEATQIGEAAAPPAADAGSADPARMTAMAPRKRQLLVIV
jgi:hypothetical protein